MADINGLVKRRATLSNGVEQTVTFGDSIQSISIAIVSGVGSVAYKFNDTLSVITDDESNILNEDVPVVDEYERGVFSSISFLSDADITIQWTI